MPRTPALAAFSRRRFGVPTLLRERTVSVPSTGYTIEANPNRLHALYTNHGAIYGTLTFAMPGAIDTGARLDPNGGALELDPEVDGEGVGYSVRLFSSGANINVTLIETIALDDVMVEV